MRIYTCQSKSDCRFGGVVVITSALHAEGPGFNPRSNLGFVKFNRSISANLVRKFSR